MLMQMIQDCELIIYFLVLHDPLAGFFGQQIPKPKVQS